MTRTCPTCGNRAHLLTAFGRTQTLAKWSEESGLTPGTITTRIYELGWPIEESLMVSKGVCRESFYA